VVLPVAGPVRWSGPVPAPWAGPVSLVLVPLLPVALVLVALVLVLVPLLPVALVLVALVLVALVLVLVPRVLVLVRWSPVPVRVPSPVSTA